MHTRRIIKFGGSSLANAARFKTVAAIIAERLEFNPIVVVSALGATEGEIKITDSLKELGLALLQGKTADDLLQAIIARHLKILKALRLEAGLLEADFEALRGILKAIAGQTFPTSNEALDAIMGFGEILCAKIMAAYLRKQGLNFSAADPKVCSFTTNDNFQNADILDSSLAKMAAAFISAKELLVFPGYIGCTQDGRRTTLGRGGSDYTAAIIGAALKRDVEIWTDVDGIYRIPPKYMPEQFKCLGHPETIPELSYEEAFQMAAFGSRVLYEKAMLAVQQAVRKGKHIRLIIKNTFNPKHPGTIISSERRHSGEPRGITCLEGTQIFNLYPDSNAEAAEFNTRIRAIPGLTPLLASETSGRLSYVFDAYNPELSKLESRYHSHLSKDQVLIKIVGDGLGENPVTLSRIHNSLQSAENPEKYGMTVVHKSPQLLTDNTFEFLVKKRGLTDVLLVLYKDLFMRTTVSVGMLGLGTVGKGVLHYAKEMYSSTKGGFDLKFPAALVRTPAKHKFAGTLTTAPEDILHDPTVDIVLEVMGGLEPARSYILEAFKQGKDVVTANKALLAEHGVEIFEAAYKYRRNLGFEASVCGEIPIIDDLLKFPGMADIEGLEGIVNGTSNYVLSRFSEGQSLAQAIKSAQDKGFAEADPYLDISGTDAAQKLAILASILFNQPIDFKAISRQGLEGLLPIDRMAFDRWDVILKPLVMAKSLEGKITLRVAPALVSKNHPLAAVRDENNALALYLSGRSEPITKIGKGAGAIPTARSVVRDILEVSKKSRSFMLDLPEFFKSRKLSPISAAEEFRSNWYVRFTVGDEPGVFGKLSTILGECGLSIKHVLQEDFPKENTAYIMLEIKTAACGSLHQALSRITAFPFVHNYFYCMAL